MKKFPRFTCSPFLLLALSVLVSWTTRGADVNSVWTGFVRDWSVATNWTPNANYPNNGNGGLTYNARVSAGTATLTEPIALQQYTNAGGTLTGDFPLTINELFTWSGGAISGNAPVNVLGGAALITGTKTLAGRTLNISGGTANWSAGNISSGSGAVLNIDPPAEFNASFDGSYSLSGGGTSVITNRGSFRKSGGTGASGTSVAAVFNNLSGGTVTAGSGVLNFNGGGNNSGTFNVSAGATLSFGGTVAHNFDSSSLFSGAGTVRVIAGTFNMGGGFDLQAGGTTVSGGTANFTNASVALTPGNLDLSGGTVVFDTQGPVIAVRSVDITGGTLGGGDSLDVAGGFVWGGGTLSGSGVIQPLAGMTLNGTTKTLTGRTLSLPGGTTNTWSLGNINSGQGAVLNIDALAVFNSSFDGQYNFSAGGSSVITNRGIFRKSGGVATTAVAPPFVNLASGAVSVTSGTLSFNGGGSGAGSYAAGSGATLRFGGGSHTLGSTSLVSGPGTNSVSAGSVTFGGGYDVVGGTVVSGGAASFTGPVTNVGSLIISGNPTVTFDTGGAVPATSVSLAGGTLSGGDTINAAGGFAWSGGRLDGASVFNANGNGTFNGGTKTLNARTLNLNSGTTTWSLGGINSGGGALLNNAAIFNITFDGAYNDTVGGSSTIFNSGTFRKSSGTVTTTIAPVFNNGATGRVEAQSGTLNFTGGGASSGDFDVSAAATLSFGGGSHALDAASSVAGAGTNAVSIGSVNYAGAYNITGGTRVSGGSANFSGPVTSVGALAVSGGTATFAGGTPINAVSAVVSGGSLGGSDTITVAGPFNWSGGALAGSGVFNANGPLTMNTGNRSLTSRLNVNNATTWSAGSINSGQSAQLSIDSLAVFDNTFDGRYQFSLGGSSVITNRGTFRKSGGVGTSNTSIDPVFNNAPTAAVDVTSGTLSLNGGGNSGGTFTVAANSTLQFGGGTHLLDAASTISGAGTNRISAGSVVLGGAVSVTGGITVSGGAANFTGPVTGGVPLFVSSGQANFNGTAGINFAAATLSGGSIGGTNDLTLSGPFNWTGGTLGGSGNVLASGGATFANNSHTFSGRKLTIPAGRLATWTSGNFNADQGATLEIAGTWEMNFDGQYFSGFNGSAVITNTGTIRKSGGNGSTAIGVTLNNNGALEVNSGRVDLSGGGSGIGSFTAAATKTLGFASGSYDLGAGSSIGGSGTVSFEGATVSFGGTYNVSGTSGFTGGTVNFTSGATVQSLGTDPSIAGGTVNFDTGSPKGFPTLAMSAGTLGGSDAIEITNLFSWGNGTLRGTGVVNARGGVTMNNFSRTLSGRRLNLFGSSTWSAGSISTDNGAVFYIQPGATLVNSFDGFIGGIIGNGGITNAGTFRKSGGSAATQFISRLDNIGTVEINTGTLDFSFAAYSQTAGTTFLNGGNLTVGLELELLGGVLTGAGTVTGNITNAGAVNPGAPLGVLTVNGEFRQGSSGVLNIDLGGAVAGTGYDQVNLTGPATAVLGGTLNVNLTNGFLPNIGDSFRIMTFQFKTGDFSSFTGFDLGVTDRHLEAVYDSNGLTLVTRAGPLTTGPTLTLQLLPPSTLELTWLNQFSDFHLESTTNLAAPNWQPFGSPGTNQVFVVVDPAEPQRYFRLEKP